MCNLCARFIPPDPGPLAGNDNQLSGREYLAYLPTMIMTPEATLALERQTQAEIRSLTDDEALHASEQLLCMASTAWYPKERDQSSGLIERQRILYQLD